MLSSIDCELKYYCNEKRQNSRVQCKSNPSDGKQEVSEETEVKVVMKCGVHKETVQKDTLVEPIDLEQTTTKDDDSPIAVSGSGVTWKIRF